MPICMECDSDHLLSSSCFRLSGVYRLMIGLLVHSFSLPVACSSPSQKAAGPQNQSIYTYTGHSGIVYAVVWSLDGKHIASTGADRTVQVWDAFTGKDVLIFHAATSLPDGYPAVITALAWSPDGKYLASASNNHTVKVWDATTAKTILTYPLTGIGEAIAWSPNGKSIAVGGSAKVVYVWGAATGHDLAMYQGHTDFIHALAWSSDGRNLASGASDHTVRVWPSP